MISVSDLQESFWLARTRLVVPIGEFLKWLDHLPRQQLHVTELAQIVRPVLLSAAPWHADQSLRTDRKILQQPLPL
jgi:hypothetical protein